MRTEALRDATVRRLSPCPETAPRLCAQGEVQPYTDGDGGQHLSYRPASPLGADGSPAVCPPALVPHPKPAAPKPVGKKRWASLQKPREGRFIETALPKGVGVTPTTRLHGWSWWTAIRRKLTLSRRPPRRMGERVIIVDIMHVLKSLESRQSPVRPRDPHAAQWVADQIEHLLQGQVSTIVNSLRRSSSLKS